jgi:hypothetical protein
MRRHHGRGPRSGGGCVETATVHGRRWCANLAGGSSSCRTGGATAADGTPRPSQRPSSGYHVVMGIGVGILLIAFRRDPDVRRARHGGRSRSACGRLGSDAHRRGRARAVLRVLEPAPSHAPRRGRTLGLRRHHPTTANTARLAVHIPAGPRPTDCRRSTSPRSRQCASQCKSSSSG